MRRAAGLLVVLLAVAPAGLAQPVPSVGCAPSAVERAPDPEADRAAGLVLTPGNQAFTATWTGAAGAAGYRLLVHEGGQVRVHETADTSCRLDAVNGRLYAVQVQVVTADGTLGPPSDPVAVRPAFEGDFLLLTLGLGVVWVGLWGYALLLVRWQRRLVVRYEALFKNGPSGGAQ